MRMGEEARAIWTCGIPKCKLDLLAIDDDVGDAGDRAVVSKNSPGRLAAEKRGSRAQRN